jgi:hypothetical protein
MRTWAGGLVLLGAVGCNLGTASPLGEDVGGGGAIASDDAGAPSDPGAGVLASIVGGAYATSTTFTHAARAPYPSSAAQGASIDSWVSADAWPVYATISPDVAGSGAKLPAGTTIVRAVLGASGAVTKLTLMAKGPPGYNPALGDWWFGETDATGAPLDDDAGALTGRVIACYSCHLARATDDYVFGVPAADRAGP